MTEQEDPAQQEIERMAQGDAPGLARTDKNTIVSGDEPLGSESSEQSSSTTGDSDAQTETSGDALPGYQ